MKDKKKLLMILGVVSIVLITIGIGYAFFSYSKNGSTENTISSDSITFLYDEVDQQGNGITLTNALPISDTEGKGQIQDFDFRIVSDTSTGISIPYEITLRKKVGSDDIDNIVKVYLAKTTDSSTTIANEQEVELSKYSDLETVTKNGHQEKLLHIDKVPGSNSTYNQGYRLKMWIDGNTDYSEITVPAKCSDGSNKTEQECTSPNEWIAEHNEYPYNDKTFAVTVNVYANGHAITQQDIENASQTTISSITAGGNTATTSNQTDYRLSLPTGTEETTINVETVNPYTTVVIEKTDSTYENVIAMNSGIQKLSTSKKVSLSEGENYFRIRLTSEDTTSNSELHLKITVEKLAGFFANDGTFISWDELVNTYGLTSNLSNGTSVLNTIGKEGKLVLSSSVTTIRTDAFNGSNKLTEIEMTDSVTSVGASAFRSCSKLETVVLSNSLTSTPSAMFYGCGSLKNVTLPNSITSIGSSTFSGCGSLDTIIIPNGVQSIGESAFANTAVTQIVIPESVTSVSTMVISFCKKITSVTFEDPNNWYKGNQLLDLSNPQSNVSILGNLNSAIAKRDS